MHQLRINVWHCTGWTPTRFGCVSNSLTMNACTASRVIHSDVLYIFSWFLVYVNHAGYWFLIYLTDYFICVARWGTSQFLLACWVYNNKWYWGGRGGRRGDRDMKYGWEAERPIKNCIRRVWAKETTCKAWQRKLGIIKMDFIEIECEGMGWIFEVRIVAVAGC